MDLHEVRDDARESLKQIGRERVGLLIFGCVLWAVHKYFPGFLNEDALSIPGWAYFLAFVILYAAIEVRAELVRSDLRSISIAENRR